MNNKADLLEGGNKEVCGLSSKSDSDSESFCIVGVPSDCDSDSFILVSDACDAESVEDNKSVNSPVDEESWEVYNKIKNETPTDQVDMKNGNINNEDNLDKNDTTENVHDMAPTAEEVRQTDLVDHVNKGNKCSNEEEEVAKETEKFIEEETAIAKRSEDIVNNKIKTNEISVEKSNPVTCESSNSIEENIDVTDEEEQFTEGKECTDEEECTEEEGECTDEEEECTDEEEEYTEEEFIDEEKPPTTITKYNEDGSDEFCKDIVSSEAKTTETSSVNKEIEQLKDDYSNVTDNINNKKDCSDAEKKFTVEEKSLNNVSHPDWIYEYNNEDEDYYTQVHYRWTIERKNIEEQPARAQHSKNIIVVSECSIVMSESKTERVIRTPVIYKVHKNAIKRASPASSDLFKETPNKYPDLNIPKRTRSLDRPLCY